LDRAKEIVVVFEPKNIHSSVVFLCVSESSLLGI